MNKSCREEISGHNQQPENIQAPFVRIRCVSQRQMVPGFCYRQAFFTEHQHAMRLQNGLFASSTGSSLGRFSFVLLEIVHHWDICCQVVLTIY